MGRPTKLQERHIELIDEYVSKCGDDWEEYSKSSSSSEKGSSESHGYRLNVKLPTFCGLQLFFSKASKNEKNKDLRISEFTIKKWRDDGQKIIDEDNLSENQELLVSFSTSLIELLKLQEEMLLNGGVSAQYGQVITKLMLSSNHGYSEKSESKVEHTGTLNLGDFFKDAVEKKDVVVK